MDRETVFFWASGFVVKQSLLLRGGRVVDPRGNLDLVADVRVHNGVIAAIGSLDPEPRERVIDVAGLVVAPGLIDVHVHLREPGQEWKETIASGTAAAAAGGFTTIFCMPNTEPALDSVAALEELRRRTDRDGVVSVRAIAAISEGRRGQIPVDYDALIAAGAVGFSDDGDSTASSAVMRSALVASKRHGRPVMVHCEDGALTGGALNEGDISRELGLQGLPAAAEELMIGRDLALAAWTEGWLHVCHVSTGRGAELIAEARGRGVRVTAEVMPHHMMMTDEWVAGRYSVENTCDEKMLQNDVAAPDTKVNPPLRTRQDTLRLLRALRAGNIDVVATDHAPHALPEKQGRSFPGAAFGMSGSEFALPLMLALVRATHLTLSDAIRCLSTTPARLWRLDAGCLRPGAPADIVVFDADESWTPSCHQLVSRSTNSPLLGMELRGRTKLTLVHGDERYCDS